MLELFVVTTISQKRVLFKKGIIHLIIAIWKIRECDHIVLGLCCLNLRVIDEHRVVILIVDLRILSPTLWVIIFVHTIHEVVLFLLVSTFPLRDHLV
jgi:hypothetical protein